MLKLVRVAAFAAIVPLVACGGGSKLLKADLDATKEKKAKLAIVSLTVNDYGGQLQNTSNSNVEGLVAKKIDEMLGFSEQAFASAGWTVVPTSEIVAAPAYKKASVGKLFEGVYGPKPGGQEMLSLANRRKDLVKTQLDPKVASELCAGLGVDLVALVYSEWAVDTNSFTGLTSPLTKNVVGVFDAQGRQLFQARQDEKGDKVLGAFGRAVVDAATLDVWVGAFQKGLNTLIQKM